MSVNAPVDSLDQQIVLTEGREVEVGDLVLLGGLRAHIGGIVCVDWFVDAGRERVCRRKVVERNGLRRCMHY